MACLDLDLGSRYPTVDSPKSGVQADMEHLPIELRRTILQCLDLLDVKSLRLASKVWATLGEEYLISPTFTSFPHRPDLSRLVALSQHPIFNYRIQNLCFNHGEVNEYHARHNTYFIQYVRNPEERAEPQIEAWSTYATIKSYKERYLPASCDPDVLRTVFGALPNLRSIEVTLMTCPFQEDDHPDLLKDVWRIPSTRLLPRVATTERFTNILTAVASNFSVLKIKSLSHDRLPFEFFAQKPILISLLSTAFISLTTLKLALAYSDLPNNLHASQAFQNLTHCIRSAAALETLELDFLGRKKVEIAYLLSSFEEHDPILPNLERLALKGIVSTETDLGNFLTRLRTLRHLRLGGLGLKDTHQRPIGGVYLNQGSFRGLFARVRHELDLLTFEAQGDLVGLESGERWVLDYVEDVDKLKEYLTD